MSGPIRTDEIEKFLTSVRGFVTHQSSAPQRSRTKSELLVLTAANRVDDEGNETGETSVEYERIRPDDVSNVHHLDVARQPERAGLEATIAELEAAVTEQPEEFEPDEGESFAQEAWAASAFQTPEADSPQLPPEEVDEPVAEEAVAEDTDRSAIASQIAEDVEAAFGARDVAANALQQIDNDTLRDMVTDIIREELAGELGEKVTRNVRKLVRREINRALMARGLD